MIRRPLVLSVVLFVAACKSNPPGLSTIEEGEAYAQAHGVVLTGKSEEKEQLVAPRAYRFKANGAVEFAIAQFASERAAVEWKKMSDELPFGGTTHIQKGIVVFDVWGATDVERQKVIDALK